MNETDALMVALGISAIAVVVTTAGEGNEQRSGGGGGHFPAKKIPVDVPVEVPKAPVYNINLPAPSSLKKERTPPAIASPIPADKIREEVDTKPVEKKTTRVPEYREVPVPSKKELERIEKQAEAFLPEGGSAYVPEYSIQLTKKEGRIYGQSIDPYLQSKINPWGLIKTPTLFPSGGDWLGGIP